MKPDVTKLLGALIWLAVLAAIAALLWPRPQLVPDGWWINRDTDAVLAMHELAESVYLAGYAGLMRAAPGSAPELEHIGLPEACSGEVYALEGDGHGGMWLGCKGGLFHYAGGTTSGPYALEGRQAPAEVRSLALAGSGTLWIGTKTGLYRLEQPAAGQLADAVARSVAGPQEEFISALLVVGAGALWVGTYNAPSGGVSLLSSREWRHFTLDDGLPHPNITSFCELPDGKVIAGCGFHKQGGAAVFEMRGGQWQLTGNIDTNELAGPKVRSLCFDSNGLLWLGSEMDGLAIRRDGRTLAILRPSNGLPSYEVMSILEARDGAIWLGTLSAVARIEPGAVDALLESGT